MNYEISRYYAINLENHYMDYHKHSAFEIMYVARGECQVFCDSSHQEEKFLLKAGDYIWLPPFLSHKLIVEEKKKCRILNLEFILRDSSDILNKTMVCHDDSTSLCSVILLLQRELRKSAFSQEKTQLLFRLFFSELTEQMQENSSIAKGNRYVLQCNTYLEEHYDSSITIPSISQHLGISTAYLQKLYHQEMGYTIIHRIHLLRIEKAKYLLTTTDFPVIDISCIVGFSNRQHFSKVFQELCGCSPAQYRKGELGNGRYLYT